MKKRIEANVKGRVQMVMFRDFTQRKARALGLVGTVKNMDDGSVRVIAEGEEPMLNEFIAKLHEGSVLSRVDNVGVAWSEAFGDLSDFRIVY